MVHCDHMCIFPYVPKEVFISCPTSTCILNTYWVLVISEASSSVLYNAMPITVR